MKKSLFLVAVTISGMLLLNGCVAAIGNKDAQARSNSTLGQQLVDLKKAHDAGALSDAEYEAQKARFLNH
jgi:hypothetical protein